MKVKWLGHAAFLVTSSGGLKILTDPYGQKPDRMTYGEIEEAADIVTTSHEHWDHNFAAGVKGNPAVVKGEGTQKAKTIEFKGIASYHDTTQGSQRGPNTIFCFTVDEIRICHLGDIGHRLSDQQVAAIGAVDICLFPPAVGQPLTRRVLLSFVSE